MKNFTKTLLITVKINGVERRKWLVMVYHINKRGRLLTINREKMKRGIYK